MIRRWVIIVASTSTLFACSIAHADRVGYKFLGELELGQANEVDFFGFSIKDGAEVSGSFAYDATVLGTDDEPGVRRFHQYISGGYSLNIKDEDDELRLTASDYDVVVANDFDSPAMDLFIAEYNYDRGRVTPEELLVNGTVWSGDRAFINLFFSWDWTRFGGPDEPELTADRPLTSNAEITGLVGSSSGAPPMLIVTQVSAIDPRSGDYNYDGRVDVHDYAEWRKAFGIPQSLYADGNSNGEVDAADYVVWRDASGSAGNLASVPEPRGELIIATAIVLFIWRRKP